MGLLDDLTSGGGIGGLLSYLQSPYYQSPLQQGTQDDFVKAIRGGTMEGALPQLQSTSPWDQPGIKYGPAPTPGVFASGAPAFGGAPSFPPQDAPPQPPQPPQPAPAPMPAPQNSPINTMNIGGYQMPQMGSVADYTPPPQQATSTDISAQSRAPQQPQQTQPNFLSNEGGLGAGLRGFANNLHTGPLGALIGGIGSAAGMQNPAQQNQKVQYEAVYQTLRQGGESENNARSKAMLAVLNPEAGKTILSEALTSKEQYKKTGVDALGNEQYGFVNERDQTINGKPIGQGDGGQTGGFLAPGVKQVDSTLKGNDYLTQFSPEVQAAVKDYADGKSMPTGNPRKGFTQTVKMIAQKYGADTGQSIDDTTYSARRTMRNQLSSSAPSSLGGQINIGNTAAGHLADLTQKALDLGNVDTGIAPLTSAVNSVRGLGTEQAAKMEALKGAAQHYGQEITKFYAGSPGGTAERDRFIESVNGARSPKELAAILATEGELMRSRLDALGGQIKGVLGEEGMKQYPVLRPDGEAALAKVETNVARLKGGQGPTSGIPSGWSVKVR